MLTQGKTPWTKNSSLIAALCACNSLYLRHLRLRAIRSCAHIRWRGLCQPAACGHRATNIIESKEQVMKNADHTDEQVTKRMHRYDKYLLLSWKRILIIAGAWVLSVVLHNVIYGLFYEYFRHTGGDEAVFFTLAIFIIPLYFIASFVYTVVKKVSKLVGNKAS
jgi:hypothetical protein